MRTLVEIGLLNALMASVLALGALAARRWNRRPALVHGLWVLVLLKLVTPPLVDIPVLPPVEEPVPAILQPTPPPVVARATASSAVRRARSRRKFILSKVLAKAGQEGKLPPLPEEDEPVSAVADPPDASESPVEVSPADPVPAIALVHSKPWSPPAWLFDVVGGVWVSGCVMWFAVTGRRIVHFHQLLRYAVPAPATLQERAKVLSRRMGLSRCPSVWLVPGALPPLLWTIGARPRLFFPQTLLEHLSEDSRDTLLVHELAHLCRRDHWIRAIEWLALGFYWWNPLAWYGCRALHAVEEECCDAWVVSELPEAAPAYAGALLETVDFLAGAQAVLPPAASGFGRMYSLKRRLTMIMHGTTPRGLSLIGRLALLSLALTLLPLVPGRARPAPKSDDATAVKEQADGKAAAQTTEEESQTIEAQPRTLQGVGGEIWSVAVSPNGEILAVGSGGAGEQPGDLHLWDLAKGKELVTVREDKPIRRVAFSPDGKTLATAEFDTTTKLRDPHTGAVRLVLRGHSAAVNCVVFTPDSKTVITAGLDNKIKLWDAATGEMRRTLEGHTDGVLSVAVSRDGDLLISGSMDHTARLWKIKTGKALATLKGHDNDVKGVGIAPDGKTLATASQDMTVKLWDATGKELRTLAGHKGSVNAAEFSPDGKLLATCSHDNTVRLWDLDSGDSLAVLEGHTGIIHGLSFSPDGKTLVSGSWDKKVKVWDVTTRKERVTLQAYVHRPENFFPLLSMTCSPDGKTLAVSGEEKIIKLLDAASGRLLRLLEGHSDIVTQVAFSPDGKTLASAGFDYTIKLWDVETGKERATLKGHRNWVFSVVFSPDNKTLASGGYDKTVKLWDVTESKLLTTLKGHRGGVRRVTFSPDGKRLASASSDRTVKLWDVTDPSQARDALMTLKGHEGAVRCVAFAPGGRILASGGEDNMLRMWDVGTGKQIASLQHGDMVLALAFSTRGGMLASAGQDSITRILDPNNLSRQTLLRGHNDAITCLCFAPDGRALFTGSADRTVKRWPAAKGMMARATVRDHKGPVWFAHFSPDGQWLVTGGDDKLVRLRRVEDLRREVDFGMRTVERQHGGLVLRGHKGAVSSAAFTADGKLLATGSWDKTARVWDLKTNTVRFILKGHTEGVRGVAFTPDGKLLATASEDHTVKLWDVATGRETRTLKAHEHPVYGLAFAPDGKTLATSSGDWKNPVPGEVKLWEVETGEEKAILKGYSREVWSLAFSPDGKYLVTGGGTSGNDEEPDVLKVWEVATNQEILSVNVPPYIRCVSFSPDGKMFATGLGNGTVKLWDTATQQERATLPVHGGLLSTVTFSPDSKMLATSSKDGTAKLWDLPASRTVAQKDK